MIPAVDATVWPNDGLLEQVGMLNTICSMSSNNIGHIQLPLSQAQTTMSAVVKHKRKIEDALLKADVDFSHEITLGFSKETVRAGSDKRPVTQKCLIIMVGKGNRWMDSECITTGILGPLTVCNVSDMQGYDAESRPSPSARVEQTLSLNLLDFFVSNLKEILEIVFGMRVYTLHFAQQRKGVACHKQIIQGYLKGMNMGDKDKVLWADLVPNKLL